MTSINASQAKQNLLNLLKKSIENHMPIKISCRIGNAILISEEDYGNLLETFELLSTPEMAKNIKEAKEDIKAGRTKSLKEVFGR